MPTTKKNKWLRRKKPLLPHQGLRNGLDKAKEKRRNVWLDLPIGLPTKAEKRSTLRDKEKVKRKHSSERRKERNRLRAIAYQEAEERDHGYCRECGSPMQAHHHIIKVGTRLPAWLIERKENIVCICDYCHVYGPQCAHASEGKGLVQIKLEEWQKETYPEYVAEVWKYQKIKQIGMRERV